MPSFLAGVSSPSDGPGLWATATQCYLASAETVRESKEKYDLAIARANEAHPTRPSWFSPYSYSEFEVSNNDG